MTMLDRRDFEEWWAREEARNSTGPIGADYRHWAEAGFFAAQTLLRNHVRNQTGQVRKPTAALLGARHDR